MAFRGWTSTVRQAWQWVKSGLERAMGRGEAKEQYVEGGGEVEPGEWEDAWQKGERLFAEGKAIGEFEGSAVIPRFMYEVVDIDYAGTFHMTAEVGYFDTSTQTWEEKWVSTNLNELASRDDWDMALIDALLDTETSPDIDWELGISIWGYKAEERM